MRKFKLSETVDFVVVGSGAAGGVMARELAQGGFSVVVLEQGPRLNAADFEHDELKYAYLSGITNDPATSPQTFRDDPAKTATRPLWGNSLIYARMVGGSSSHFTANYWRFHEVDFHERELLGNIPGTGFADWPISYQELEPYYTKVEWDIGVSGLAYASPFDPPRSKPYPMPPLPVKSSGVLLERGARKLGLHPFPAPMAIASELYQGRPGCAHCGFCMGFGCEVMAKSSTLYTMIPQAEATGRCEIRPHSYAFKIAMNSSGRSTGVLYFDEHKREHLQKARAVVLSANGGEAARLLLNSTSRGFVHGLANSSGLVGKYLMFNQGAGVHAQFEHELNEYKSVQVTRIIHDFYDADLKRGFYGGGGIDARMGPQPIGWALAAGGDFKARLEAFPRSMMSTAHCTSLAVESNSVSLDPKLKDAWSIPAIRVTYKDHPDDLATASFLQERIVEIMQAAGAQKIWRAQQNIKKGGVHLLGTCRMGNDPATSFVDKFHRTHDVPNLFLCDGSSFVTSGGGQPTMTIQALAFRAADHIGHDTGEIGVDATSECSHRVAARGIDEQAKAASHDWNPDGADHNNQKYQCVGYPIEIKRPRRKIEKGRRCATSRPLHDKQCDATQDESRRQRHHHIGNARDLHQQPVGKTLERADEDDEHTPEQRSAKAAVNHETASQHVGDRYHRADREIDPARYDDDRLRAGRQRQGQSGERQRLQLERPEARVDQHGKDHSKEQERWHPQQC